jgi:GT2 family glycosyltransferase
MRPEISVIIPVYRDWARLSQCLEALERQSVGTEAFEIIVANNEPESRVLSTRLPANARVVHEPRPGSYIARNAAVAASRAPVLAFTDSDCVPGADWLKNGMAALRAHPHARITGPIKIFKEPGAAHYAFVHDLHMAFRQRENVAAGHCVTANLLVAREVFDRVGPFDPCLSGGDVRWGRRAHACGVPIRYVDDVEVAHPARRSLAEILRKRRRTGGSLPREVTVRAFVYERIRPPFGRLRTLRRQGVGLADAWLVFSIHWIARLVEAHELSLVRLGFRQPARS